MLLRNIHVHVPIRRSQFCRERLNYDTIESNSRPFNRNRRGFLVPRSEKIDISKRRDKRWTRATRCTIHGGKNKIWNGVCFNFQDRTCWLDLRFDSRQWLRLDIIVRFNFQRVTPSNYDRYIYREREWQAWYMCYICVCVYNSGESIKIIQRKYIII